MNVLRASMVIIGTLSLPPGSANEDVVLIDDAMIAAVAAQVVAESIQRPEPEQSNFWSGAAAEAFLSAEFLPYWVGSGIDLYTTQESLELCRHAGRRCREGNPLAGGDSNAGRMATTLAVGYALGAALELVERKGKPAKGWQKLLLTGAIGSVRAAVGLLVNKPLADDVREELRLQAR